MPAKDFSTAGDRKVPFRAGDDPQTAMIDPGAGAAQMAFIRRSNESKGAESVLSCLLGLVGIRQFKPTTTIDRTKSASKLVGRAVDRPIATPRCPSFQTNIICGG